MAKPVQETTPLRAGEPAAPPLLAWMMMAPDGRLIGDHLYSSERVAWMSVADPGPARARKRKGGWRAVHVRIEVVT